MRYLFWVRQETRSSSGMYEVYAADGDASVLVRDGLTEGQAKRLSKKLNDVAMGHVCSRMEWLRNAFSWSQ